jgi:hypothetical protein
MDDTDMKTVEEWLAFGDPSLQIKDPSLAPYKPSSPAGPASGKIKETYTYSTVTTDPEGDDLYYLFDWGNDEYSQWIGPFESGETCEVDYTWDTKGTFSIRVMAKDIHGVQSEWSDPSIVSMPRTRLDRLLFQLSDETSSTLFDLLALFFKPFS